MKETNMKTRLLTLKTIKTIFDVVLVLTSLLVVSNIVLHVLNVTNGNDIIAGLALIEQKTEPMVIEGDINTTIDGLTVNMKPVGLQVSYYFGGVDEHPVVVLHRMLYLVALNLSTIFFIFVLFLIRNIVNSVYKSYKTDNDSIGCCVFTRKNISRLRCISVGFVIMPFIELLVYYLDKLFLQRYVSIDGMSIVPVNGIGSVAWDYILVGLLFFVLIEVFRKGLRLQEENDLTV